MGGSFHLTCLNLPLWIELELESIGGGAEQVRWSKLGENI